MTAIDSVFRIFDSVSDESFIGRYRSSEAQIIVGTYNFDGPEPVGYWYPTWSVGASAVLQALFGG